MRAAGRGHSPPIMQSRLLLLFSAGAGTTLIALACGGATTTSVGSTNDSDNGNDASASGRYDNGSDASTGWGGADGSSWDNGQDASASLLCGESSATQSYPPCPTGYFCDRGNGVCHGVGTCKAIPPPPPPSCPAYPEMVCGCDGKAYCSDEYAHTSGVGVAVEGGCTTPCGSLSCNALTEYCDHAFGGVALPDGGVNEWYACKSFAAAGCTEKRTCGCVQANPSTKGEQCGEPNGHVEVRHFYP